jgi:predicted dehydrogenase
MQDNRLNSLEAEDTTVALVRFEDGAPGTIEATTAARPEDMDASLTLIGEKGYASIGGIALNMVNQWHFDDQVDDSDEVRRKWSQEVENGYGYSHGPLLQEIIRRVNSGSVEPPISAESAAETVALIHSLYRSVEDQRTVYVNRNLLSRNLGRSADQGDTGSG